MDKWVNVKDQLPPEHTSIFASFKGTNKWIEGMFENISEDVLVTVKFEDGSKKTCTAHTRDGIWSRIPQVGHPVVTHWIPFPKPAED